MTRDVPYDASYHFPAGELRAVPDDAEEMRQAVAWLEEQAERGDDPDDRARALGLAGAYAGILRDLGDAARMLDEALSLTDAEEQPRRHVVLLIRRADIHALEGDPHGAVRILRPLVDRCRGDDRTASLEPFVRQHLGKALVEAGEVAAGIDHLERALCIRQEQGEPDLLDSTRHALTVARSRLP